jgi:MscS family membrane protein
MNGPEAPVWLKSVLPATLHRTGPAGLELWQWLALPLLALLALGLGRVLGGATTMVLLRLSRRSKLDWDDELAAVLGPTVTLLWASVAAAVLLPWLGLPAGPYTLVQTVLAAVATFACFWGLWRSVDIGARALAAQPWVADDPSTRSLLSAGRNLLKAFLSVAGVVSILAVFGYPVATVLTGLGIGGVALAFGAQKTVENLFGSVSLAVDQPFRVGDFVRIEGNTMGTVERIGMRSTQVRTLDRTLVTLPNGKLADMQIEDFASRERIRFNATIGVVYGTTEAQMQRVLEGIETFLKQHPHIWPDTVVVRFAGFGASSLDIEIMCWFQTTDFNTFRNYRQETLLAIMRIVEEAGSSFAFPTQTLHVVQENAQG